MKCFNCSAVIPKNAKFCGSCGKKTFADQDLIDRALAKDESAQAELYKRAYDGIYWTVMGMIRDEDATWDVMQEAYLSIFQKLSLLKTPETYTEWAKRIAANSATDWLRKNKREVLFSQMETDDDGGEVELKFEDDDTNNNPDVVIDRNETARLVREILDSIDEKYRAVVTMVYMDGMKLREVAETLGLSENTVKTRVSRGKKQVEEKVLRLEKQGTKLYTLAPFPFFLWLLRNLLADSAALQHQQAVYGHVLAAMNQIGVEMADGSAHAVTDAIKHINMEMADNADGLSSHMSDAIGKMNQAAGTAASAAGKGAAAAAAHGIGTKIAVGIVIAAVGAGAAGGGTYVVLSHHAEQTEADAEAEQETEEQTAATDPEKVELYQAYYDLLKSDEETYGSAQINEGSLQGEGEYAYRLDYLSGLCFAKLVDFDGDGSEELVLGYQGESRGGDFYDYVLEVWDYQDGECKLVYSGSEYGRHEGSEDAVLGLTEMDGVPYVIQVMDTFFGPYEFLKLNGGEFSVQKAIEFDVEDDADSPNSIDGESATYDEASTELGLWMENETRYLVEDYVCPGQMEDTSNRDGLELSVRTYNETMSTLCQYLGISEE